METVTVIIDTLRVPQLVPYRLTHMDPKLTCEIPKDLHERYFTVRDRWDDIQEALRAHKSKKEIRA